MSFDELLFRAKAGDMEAKTEIFAMYRPLLIKNALVNGRFDEDLYQEAGSGTDEVHPVFPGCGVIKEGPGGVSCPVFLYEDHIDFLVTFKIKKSYWNKKG